MTSLVDQILEKLPYDVFTDTEVWELIQGSKATRYNLVKRALAKQEIIRVRKGLYCLPKRYQRQGIHPFELAMKISGPSYVSFESALSYHELIPEAVHTVSCATSKRRRFFQTPLGNFSYNPIPTRVFMVGVERIENNGHPFLVAKPLKALTDYVYVNKLNWQGMEALYKSLRIEEGYLKFTLDELEEIKIGYTSTRISKFIDGIRKDLQL